MQQVQGGKFARALQRLFATQGKLSLQLDPVVVPTVALGDLSDEAEGFPAMGLGSVPAGGVGNRTEIQFGLPAAVAGQGGLEIFLEEILVDSDPTANVVVHVGRTVGGVFNLANGAKEWRDSGLQGFPAALIQQRNNAAAAAGFIPTLRFNMNAGTGQIRIPINYSIVAGDLQGLMFRPNADNVGLSVGFLWREIPPT